MNKTIQIIVVVDDVPLNELEDLLQQIGNVVNKYPDHRIQTSIQDEKMVRR